MYYTSEYQAWLKRYNRKRRIALWMMVLFVASSLALMALGLLHALR